MNTNSVRINRLLAILSVLSISTIAAAAEPTVTERIEPAQIALGDSAQLTIAASANSATPIAPPVVAGLEFVAVGQSSQIQIINGRTSSTSSFIYQVIPQRIGLYTLPGIAPGSQPLVLRVLPGNSGSAATLAPGNSGTSALPPAAASGLIAGATRMSADNTAFVRLSLPTHQLYVGESIPVQIQVGMRAGLVASLNGLPTLNGDAFTLSPLSAKPAQTEQIIGGKPFTVLTWGSVLSAVKPGALSLTIETPLTVRMQTSRPDPQDLLADSSFGDVFNDPFFQSYFGATTEKDLTVRSAPAAFTVFALPTQGRPADFSGAVGKFKVSSELSADTTTAGDPLTLRLHVTGTGNFDRVNSTMLGSVDQWKTYRPTASFRAADEAGYRGEKSFEQPVIAEQSGTQTLPGMSFSYFDPDARRYDSVQTPALSVSVAPAASASTLASATPPILVATATSSNSPPPVGLRPDHVQTAQSVSSLVPLYFQPRLLAIPSVLTLAFAGAWLWMRRGDQLSINGEGSRASETSQATSILLAQMERAASAGDAGLFFNSARTTVQRSLASRWHVPASSITAEEIDVRLGTDSKELHQLFELADEATYSGRHFDRAAFQKWTRRVHREINEGALA
jgi:hypothetical protein